MNILVVNNLFPPIVFGGYEILCSQVVEEMRSWGFEVDIMTSRFRSEECPPDERVFRKLELNTDFPVPGEDSLEPDFSLGRCHRVSSQNYQLMKGQLEHKTYDAVFLWCMNRMGLGAALAALAKGVPVFYSINDEHPTQFVFEKSTFLMNFLRRFRQKIKYPMAKFHKWSKIHTTVISEATRTRLKAYGVPLDAARIIHQGVHVNNIIYQPKERLENEQLRLLYCGQLSEHKGVHTLLKSAHRLHKDNLDFCLDIVGSGVKSYENKLKEMVREFGIDSRIRFVGQISHAQVLERYRESHIFVFCSEWHEPFGLTHIEAMASGCAVISTTVGGCAELIVNEKNALAYEAGSADDLAHKIKRFDSDEELRKCLIKDAREYVETYHDFKSYTGNLRLWIEEVCGDGSRS